MVSFASCAHGGIGSGPGLNLDFCLGLSVSPPSLLVPNGPRYSSDNHARTHADTHRARERKRAETQKTQGKNKEAKAKAMVLEGQGGDAGDREEASEREEDVL